MLENLFQNNFSKRANLPFFISQNFVIMWKIIEYFIMNQLLYTLFVIGGFGVFGFIGFGAFAFRSYIKKHHPNTHHLDKITAEFDCAMMSALCVICFILIILTLPPAFAMHIHN